MQPTPADEVIIPVAPEPISKFNDGLQSRRCPSDLLSFPVLIDSLENEGSPDPAPYESTADVVLEEDTPLETCRKIANCSDSVFSPTEAAHSAKAREVLEYHDGVDSATILGELFGQRSCGRFVRLLLDDPAHGAGNKVRPTAGENMQFLERSGAFVLPPPPTWYTSSMIRSIDY